ncbi:MAG: alpha-amylase [Roseburia sp.]|nr:alpha-amylase [Roseburia sp.]MCM1278217.1 alpha-amylase [Robinsoniella sp.]
MKNETLIQYFEWYLPEDLGHWKRCMEQAGQLKEAGITMAWLPPAYKGSSGRADVGYGVYDLYDLGEFDQKGTIPTKYGTKNEYIQAIKKLQKEGIAVIADVVLNHKMGADESEQVKALMEAWDNRNQTIGGEEEIEAWTRFTFPGRKGAYSKFQWDQTCFDGVDWDEKRKQKGVFLFAGKEWDGEVDGEYSNYDYLMGADVDMSNPKVLEELKAWGKWYLDVTKADGFRLDAVKHIRFSFFNEWLREMRAYGKENFLAVGEYWSPDIGRLKHYLDKAERCMKLFDVPLHFNFQKASCGNGNFDMGAIFNGTLVNEESELAVTFVDNHDTQPGQALQSWVMDWFKPLAYGLILLQEKGLPCVFYGDYYGIPHDNIQPVKGLDKLLLLRKSYAYGREHRYFDHHDIVGLTREGTPEMEKSGLALLVTDGPGGVKVMYVGEEKQGKTFYDYMGNRTEKVVIGKDGKGEFFVEGGSISVWVEE